MTSYPIRVLDQPIELISNTYASDGQAVQTIGQQLPPGDIVKIAVPGGLNAYYYAFLPRPALPFYEGHGLFIITIFALPKSSQQVTYI